MFRLVRVILCLLLLIWQGLGEHARAAENAYQPAAENLAARSWFQDAKFGLFIHWGVYSQLGDGEWVMNNHKTPVSEYEKLAATFNPTKFDAAAWVSMAKGAGMRYITVTAKHHDGFCLFDSKHTDWDIVDRTAFKRDVMRELADECHKQGLKIFFYYSHLDWHHSDYYPWGRTGWNTGRRPAGDFNRYIAYVDDQLKELLTGYGPVAGIWFDGWWDRKEAPWRLEQTYRHIHTLQPAALVLNNHHTKPFDGEDIQGFEKDLPGQKTAGIEGDAPISALPLESCDTMSKAWGYNRFDTSTKTTRQLVHYLVRAAGLNANLLLNVGPMPDGTIQPDFVERLVEVGRWTAANGESIYGTRGGPVSPQPWGVTTRKGDRVYVHVLEWPAAKLTMPLAEPVKSCRSLTSNKSLRFEQSKQQLVITLPDELKHPIDSILVLELVAKPAK